MLYFDKSPCYCQLTPLYPMQMLLTVTTLFISDPNSAAQLNVFLVPVLFVREIYWKCYEKIKIFISDNKFNNCNNNWGF